MYCFVRFTVFLPKRKSHRHFLIPLPCRGPFVALSTRWQLSTGYVPSKDHDIQEVRERKRSIIIFPRDVVAQALEQSKSRRTYDVDSYFFPRDMLMLMGAAHNVASLLEQASYHGDMVMPLTTGGNGWLYHHTSCPGLTLNCHLSLGCRLHETIVVWSCLLRLSII